MKYFICILGIALFIIGIILFLRNGDRESLKVYGACSYIGLALGVISGSSIVVELAKIDEEPKWLWPVIVIFFILAAQFLLRPGFGKKK